MGSSTSRLSQQQHADVLGSRREVEELRLDVDFAIESRDEWKSRCEAEQRAREVEVHRLNIEVARLQAELALGGPPARSVAGSSRGTSGGCVMDCHVRGEDDDLSSSDGSDAARPPSPDSYTRRTPSATSSQRSLSESTSLASPLSLGEAAAVRQAPTIGGRSERSVGLHDPLGRHAVEDHPVAPRINLTRLQVFVVDSMPRSVTTRADVEALQAEVERAFKAFAGARRRPCFAFFLGKHGCWHRDGKSCVYMHKPENPSEAALIALRFLQKQHWPSAKTRNIQHQQSAWGAGRGPKYARDDDPRPSSAGQGPGGWSLQAPSKRSSSGAAELPDDEGERASKRSRRY